MAITVHGVVGSIDDAHWAKLLQDLGDGGNGMSVPAGLTATAATGTRVVTVAAGRSVQAGTSALMDAAQTVTLDANSAGTGKNRIDVICMQVDWAAATAAYNATAGDVGVKAAAAQNAAGSLVVVKGVAGTTPVIPALTQNPGALWQTPLALVTLPNGVGQLAASAVARCRPLPVEKTCSGTSTLVSGQTKRIQFPYFLFDEPPRVVLSAQTGAGESTISNLSTNAITKDAFTAVLARSTNVEVTFDWIASGI